MAKNGTFNFATWTLTTAAGCRIYQFAHKNSFYFFNIFHNPRSLLTPSILFDRHSLILGISHLVPENAPALLVCYTREREMSGTGGVSSLVTIDLRGWYVSRNHSSFFFSVTDMRPFFLVPLVCTRENEAELAEPVSIFTSTRHISILFTAYEERLKQLNLVVSREISRRT